MQYKCTACGKVFIHPAKQVEPKGIRFVVAEYFYQSVTETYVCPFCNSKEYTEAPEPPQEQPVNVLVIDLTSGPQIAIDRALADGYKIVNRYAKQYVLEKSVEAKL